MEGRVEVNEVIKTTNICEVVIAETRWSVACKVLTRCKVGSCLWTGVPTVQRFRGNIRH